MKQAVHDAATGQVVVRDMAPEAQAALETEWAEREAAEVVAASRKLALDSKLAKLAEMAGLDVNELREALKG